MAGRDKFLLCIFIVFPYFSKINHVPFRIEPALFDDITSDDSLSQGFLYYHERNPGCIVQAMLNLYLNLTSTLNVCP